MQTRGISAFHSIYLITLAFLILSFSRSLSLSPAHAIRIDSMPTFCSFAFIPFSSIHYFIIVGHGLRQNWFVVVL